jgi:DMSO/TMAO reductase YedYZ molybdopterin-dependent catalytic subunit
LFAVVVAQKREMIHMAILTVSGSVAHGCTLSYEQLAALPEAYQIADVRQLDPRRPGTAIRLAALFDLVQPHPDVAFLALYASRDNFHASLPLAPLRERAILIYALDGQPLPVAAGGPFRFYIPDHLACHTAAIDECANVKYVDRLEFNREPSFDNRPHDDAAHAALHARTAPE